MDNYKGKNVLVIGLGVSGSAAAKFLLDRSATVLGVDKNITTILEKDSDLSSRQKNGFTAASDDSPLTMSFDLVVISPGVPQTHRLYLQAKEKGIEVIGEVELGCRSIQQSLIGITGTNGKTTVTLLVEHVLNLCGKPAVALGNVGVPLTAELTKIDKDKIIVAELSSYQLDTMSSQVIDTGVILNVTPDHLDRYPSMLDYARSKFSMKNCIKPNGKLYVEENTLKEYGHLLEGYPAYAYGYSSSSHLYTDKMQVFINRIPEFTLPSNYNGLANHDVENILAAYAVCQTMGVSGEGFANALLTFKKPPHRIEFVEKIGDVSYYNDSKGTNIDAVIKAVGSFQNNIILIGGGVDKGASYSPWVEAFGGKVKFICAIGQAAEKMKEELSHKLDINIFSTLENAVFHASAIAKKGDIVLLSPGCSSFDMFRDYEHRGNEFKRIVYDLKGRE